jgi:signal transduction histidine kinase
MSSGSDDASRDPLESLDDAGRADRLRFFAITAEDEAVRRGIKPIAERTVDGIVADFYEHLLRFPPLAELLRTEPDRIARLKTLQHDYFLSLTDGRIDADYFESRLRVGRVHQKAGLEPSWYMGSFALYLRLAVRALVAAEGDGARILPAVEALIKAVFLDMSLAMHTYIYGGFVTRAIAERLEHAARIAEEALEARAETERLKDDLAAMVVHDLKNPVNGISMMVQLALRKSDGLPEAHRGYLEQIDMTCREMMRLIQNLLEIAKIDEGKMPITRERVVVAELVDEVARELGSMSAQAGRPLRVDVDPTLPATVADRALLKRVIVNLVVNAFRHSGSPDVSMSADADDGSVRLRVRDRGRGLTADQLSRLFEKFGAVRRSPANEPTGDTGLGLAFCKLAVECMGGRIAVDSVVGGGTEFVVTLPVHPG